MNKEQMRAQALKLVSKNVTTRAPKASGKKHVIEFGGPRAGRTFGRQKELLAQIKDNKRIFISTLDVEMTKWRFKEATGVKLILVETDNEHIYKAEI